MSENIIYFYGLNGQCLYTTYIKIYEIIQVIIKINHYININLIRYTEMCKKIYINSLHCHTYKNQFHNLTS